MSTPEREAGSSSRRGGGVEKRKRFGRGERLKPLPRCCVGLGLVPRSGIGGVAQTGLVRCQAMSLGDDIVRRVPRDATCAVPGDGSEWAFVENAPPFAAVFWGDDRIGVQSDRAERPQQVDPAAESGGSVAGMRARAPRFPRTCRYRVTRAAR